MIICGLVKLQSRNPDPLSTWIVISGLQDEGGQKTKNKQKKTPHKATCLLRIGIRANKM